MKIREALIATGAATIALAAPMTSMADVTWITTNDEAGTRIVITRDGPGSTRAAATASGAQKAGDISADREYVFTSEEAGWQLRPMAYRFESGRLVHVDDPVGHMHRQANAGPLTEQQRIALERSSGS